MTTVIVRQLAGLIGGDIHRYAFLCASLLLFAATLAGLLWLDWRSNPWRWRRHTPQHRGRGRLSAAFLAVAITYEVGMQWLAGNGRNDFIGSPISRGGSDG